MAVYELEAAKPRLRAAHKDGRLIPFLGAGFSKPLGLPSWGELVGWMAESLGFEAELFHHHGRSEQLAEYYARKGSLDKLVHEMTLRFGSEQAVAKRRASPMHQALAKLDWRTLYTTNYDGHIEGALRDAKKEAVVLASFGDFQGPRRPGACEVVKFHGTLEQPRTIVLTESEYFERMALEAPADQRLRSDLLSNSFLFIGYSFSDTNIRYIWYRMHQLRRQSAARGEGREHLPERRGFFATNGAGLVQPELLEAWGIDVILLDPADPSASVAELLQGLP
jgi:hypothetical protein